MFDYKDNDPPTQLSGSWDKCPRCHADMFPPDSSICNKCGHQIVSYLPAVMSDCSCGAHITSEDIFCPGCGRQIITPLTDRSKRVLAKVSKRKFQITFGVLFSVVAVVVLTGWSSWKADKQRTAVETLQKLQKWRTSSDLSDYKTSSSVWIFYGNGRKLGLSHPRRFHSQYRITEVWFFRQISKEDIEALQALDGLRTVRSKFPSDVAEIRAALPESTAVNLISESKEEQAQD